MKNSIITRLVVLAIISLPIIGLGGCSLTVQEKPPTEVTYFVPFRQINDTFLIYDGEGIEGGVIEEVSCGVDENNNPVKGRSISPVVAVKTDWLGQKEKRTQT
jgi:hypothetical protein